MNASPLEVATLTTYQTKGLSAAPVWVFRSTSEGHYEELPGLRPTHAPGVALDRARNGLENLKDAQEEDASARVREERGERGAFEAGDAGA
jgi:hypothetical protein